MSNYDADLLTLVSRQCFFRHQPQPLVDLLNKRGIVGRQAEVFWTYFHWGFQDGSFRCQISSAYIAELLFTDVRTVQRANERLQAAGLITRARAEKARGTHLEAPAITTITIPDDGAREMLTEAPRRGAKKANNPEKARAATNEFTDVNSLSADLPEAGDKSNVTAPPTLHESGTPYPIERGNENRGFSKIKADLPEKARRFHDVCMVKAWPCAFRRMLDELGNVSETDAEILLRPLREALELKKKEVKKAQRQNTITSAKQPPEATTLRAGRRPENPRPIPEETVSLIKQRLKACAPEKAQAECSLTALASEVIYSLTIGTMRGMSIMHGINATIKLIATKKWSRPRGMPEGWRFDHVVMGTA